MELISSFGRMPFIAGSDCFAKDVRTYPDGWTSGAWEELLPKGAKSLELSIQANRPKLDKEPLAGRLEILVWIPGRGKVPVSTQDHQWTANVPITLRIDLPSEYYNSPHVVSARLQLSSCYTPRNFGNNTDGRKLGVIVRSFNFHNGS
jgi:hypothetical protein